MNTLYERITNRLIAELERGTAPWVRPWDAVDDPIPINVITRRPYRGINNVLLQLTAGALGYERNSWLTYRQAREAGGQVRGGEEGVGIIFWQLRKVPLVGEAFPVHEDADIEERVIPLIRAYTVFNVAQVDGLPRELTAAPPSVPPWQGQEIAELLIAESKADIRHTGFRAYYQLCHWTGHPKRLDRQLGRRWGESAYAMEELIAEIGAAFLSAHCRIEGRLQHANYLASWLQVLRSDTRAIFVAATKAQAAADWLLGVSDRKPASASALQAA
jgi:antirestriction protein ArdC